ncbi:MAG: hypothetical protein OXO50_07085 [Caldilineaceae bacterium]|nr:hypothetical protein [Caldilineaceae bacterium]
MENPRKDDKRRKYTLYDYVTWLCAVLFALMFVFFYYTRATG